MNIAIPLGGQIRMVICSSFVIAKRKDATHYDLSGESFQLTGVTADQVYVFDDSVVDLTKLGRFRVSDTRHRGQQLRSSY